MDDQRFLNSQYLGSQITSITFLSHFANIVLGTKQGEILMYDFMEQDEFLKQTFPGEQVKKVVQLPRQVKDAKKHVFYVVTDSNIYCVAKTKNLFNQAQPLRMNVTGSMHGGSFVGQVAQASSGGYSHSNSNYQLEDALRLTENSSEISNSQSVKNAGTTSGSVAPGSFMTPGVKSQETIVAAKNPGLGSIEELAHVSLIK